MTAARILVVDDEPQIHRFLRPALEAEGYAVEPALTGQDALRAVARQRPDLALLDLGLPDIEGHALLPLLRAGGKLPIIVLSARDRAEEKIAALDAGADDYVEKPFDMGELLARMRAALRHALARDGATPIFESGPLRIDLTEQDVRVNDQKVALTPKEYELLAFLARAPGRVVTHRQLLERVWGRAHGEDVQYLRVYVQHLRQKLGPEAARLLVTAIGVGYRLERDASVGG